MKALLSSGGSGTRSRLVPHTSAERPYRGDDFAVGDITDPAAHRPGDHGKVQISS